MKKLLLLTTLCLILLTSCTENQRARNWGGKEEFTMPQGMILVNTTWKDHDMWLLMKDTTTGVFYFREKSSWGIWNGEIVINP